MNQDEGFPPVVRTVHSGDVATVWLDRPGSRNAITTALAQQLHEALATAAQTARVIVVRGTGGHFCVGGDFDEVARLRADGAEALRPLFEAFVGACELIAQLPVPVVAAVEGQAMAGGFELLQSCDLVVVRDDAVIADNHTNFGMIPSGGGSQRLPRIVGLPRAMGHILLGDRLTGQQLVEWGLAYRAAPAADFDAVLAVVCERLVTKDPVALQRSKQLIREGLSLPLSDGLALERVAVLDHLLGQSAAEGIRRFGARSAEEGRPDSADRTQDDPDQDTDSIDRKGADEA